MTTFNTKMNFKPVQFIKQGSVIEARFINDDELQWFKGVVQRINKVGATYVDCVVLYEDGELVDNAVFYNDDFDNHESPDAWRFEGNMSLLIEFLTKNSEEIQCLKEAIKERDDTIRQIISDAMIVHKCMREECSSSDDEEDEDYEEEEEDDSDDEDSESKQEFEVYEYPSLRTTSWIWSFVKNVVYLASAYALGVGIGTLVGELIKQQQVNKEEISY
jgi:hypothetical protein